MKKFVKGCLITALVFVLLGTTMTVGAVSAGGVQEIEKLAKEGELSFYARANLYDWDDADDWDDTDDQDDLEEKDVRTDSTAAAEKTKNGGAVALSAEETAQVKKLDLEINGGTLEVLSAEDGCIRAEADDPYGKITFMLKENTFHIVDTMKLPKWWNDWEKRTIRLYLPKDMKFEEAEFDIAGGVLEADTLLSAKVNLDVGAGTVLIKKLECDRLEGDVGAGSIELQSAVAADAEFDIGAGQLLYTGSIGNRMEADCSMGEAVFELAQQEMDFNYEVSASMGEVVISDMVFAGMKEKQRIDYKAARNIELDCSMGTIELFFRN